MKRVFKTSVEKIDKGQSSRVIIYMLSQCVLEGIAIIAMPLFTRLLTTEQYGRVSVYSTWCAILALIIGLRVDSAISVAKVHYEEKEFKKFCSNAYFVVVVTGIVAMIIVTVCLEGLVSLLRMTPIIVLFLIFHAFGTVCIKVQSSIFMITKKAFMHMGLSILLSFSACVVSVVFILLARGKEGEARILGMGLPYVIIGGFFCILYMRKIATDINKNMIQYMIALSVPMIFHGVSALVLSQSDRIMLSEMVGDGQAGIYSFCYSVATPLTAIWSALGNAWKPDYYDKLKERNNEWLKEHSDNYLFLFTCLSCGYLLVAQEALKILGTEEYWSGIPVLPFIVMACYFQFLYSFAVNYEMYCKKTNMIGVGTMVSALINILINFFLIPRYGMLGAAIATLIAYMILFIVHDMIARRLEGYHYQWSFYLKGLIPVIFCCGITYLFADNMWVRWGIGLAIAIVLIRRVFKKRTLL